MIVASHGTSYDLYVGVCQRHNRKFAYVSVSVCVCVSFPLLCLKLSLGYLFGPHQVNQGGVHKGTLPVTLYEPHTAGVSLKRHRRGRHSQVLSGHTGQASELLHVLLPLHQRVCVKGHLLHSRVGI